MALAAVITGITALGILLSIALQKIILSIKAMRESKKHEREADVFAVTRLHDGMKGMREGFKAWQESLRELRDSPALSWKDRLLMKLTVTPGGNFIPFLFSHGSFESRIRHAEKAVQGVIASRECG